ncbi:MAG TPA: hypothetical protein VJR71_06450 [Pseudolabrys sp.]|nr:hypothetical protein [Pseudolabrys sp.]
MDILEAIGGLRANLWMPLRLSRALKTRKYRPLVGVQPAFTGILVSMRVMHIVCRFFLALALFVVSTAPSPAADTLSLHATCLSKAEQRAAVAANHAISLGQAIKLLREQRRHSEVVRARLCRHDEKLVYILTLLGRSGKVTIATIDATNGEFHIAR